MKLRNVVRDTMAWGLEDVGNGHPVSVTTGECRNS